jgi:AraC family transcriptional activator of mtrCDE
MRQAAEQLQTGQVPIEQVVRNTGYESRSSFARAFREVFGMDPSEYRAASEKPRDSSTGAMPGLVQVCRTPTAGSSSV